jgi:glycosyltransferase involved in cell wall biosynthesis
MKILLADPPLFTAPYDAALSRGLRANGVTPHWITRGLRNNEEPELPADEVTPSFYPLTDGARRRTGRGWQLLKGAEHAAGLIGIAREARRGGYDAVHFQWCVVPALDRLAIGRLRRHVPVVLTVHDTTPFNGKAVSPLQTGGFKALLASVDHLIVHTAHGRAELESWGLPPSSISVIPHGLLPLRVSARRQEEDSGRWRIVMFGRLQSYKGLDLLIEAAGQLDPAVREQIEIVIAGEPQIEIEPLQNRAAALGLGEAISFRCWRHSEADMADLLASADCFVFPYRSIEASGVLFLIAGLGKWIVASDLGAFRDMVGSDGCGGELVPPGDVPALAAALARSIGRKPSGDMGSRAPGWDEIGAATRKVYESVIRRR